MRGVRRENMLIFFYGLMNSGKSSLLISMYHAAKEEGEKILVLKSCRDRLGSRGRISSRAPLTLGTDVIVDCNTRLDLLDASVFFVDEVQFFEPEQIVQLRVLADAGRLVYCFGLLTDFALRQFPASERLVALADELRRVELVRPRCKTCKTQKAIGHQPHSFEWCCYSCHAHVE